VTSGVGVVQAYRSGLFEYAFDHNLKDDVLFRFLTNLSIIDNYVEAIKELIQRAQKRSLCFESRIGDFGAGYFPRFIVRDGVELLLFLRMDEDKDSDVLDTGLWTSNKVLVHAFIAFFEGMWQNSMNIEEAMKEYEKT
jgi:hypothetical protein